MSCTSVPRKKHDSSHALPIHTQVSVGHSIAELNSGHAAGNGPPTTLSQVTATSSPALHGELPLIVYPDLQVGRHVDPDRKVSVQFPGAPSVVRITALQVVALHVVSPAVMPLLPAGAPARCRRHTRKGNVWLLTLYSRTSQADSA